MDFRLTPDGNRYLNMARGGKEPLPFHLRWLLPFVLRENTAAWVIVNLCSIIAIGWLTFELALLHGATATQGAVAMLLLLGLPSIRFALFSPVLVDCPGLALALGAAVAWTINPWVALVLVFVGGMMSEKAPVWSAIFALQPVLLVGLVAPIARRAFVSAGEIRKDDKLAWTFRPFHAGLRSHSCQWRHAGTMLAPWGACLAVIFAEPSLWLLLALAVGYAQLLVATDTARLYQQAAPVVCVVAAMTIPEAWIIPALVAHWFNPWMGSGL